MGGCLSGPVRPNETRTPASQVLASGVSGGKVVSNATVAIDCQAGGSTDGSGDMAVGEQSVADATATAIAPTATATAPAAGALIVKPPQPTSIAKVQQAQVDRAVLELCAGCPAAALCKSPYELGPPPPGCEESRLDVIAALRLMDSPPQPELESVLKLVTSIFNAKAALIALFGDRRIWVRDAIGFQQGDFPWRNSICAWTMASETPCVTVIPDVFADARFSENPVVRAIGIRFYVGAPLLASNGHRLGTVCFVDLAPRTFDAHSCQVLTNLAEMVSRELEKDVALELSRLQGQQAKQQLAAVLSQPRRGATAAPGRAPLPLLRAPESLQRPVLAVDVSQPGWPVVHANSCWGDATGLPAAQALGCPLWQLVEQLDGSPLHEDELQARTLQRSGFHVAGVRVRGGGGGGGKALATPASYTLFFSPASDDQLDGDAMMVGCPTFIPTALEAGAERTTNIFLVTLYPVKQVSAAPSETEETLSATWDTSLNDDGVSQQASMVCESQAGRRRSCGSSESGSDTPSGRLRQLLHSCGELEGLRLGGQVAAGSYGRVFRGWYYGTAVAVKVLDDGDVLRRDEASGVSLEAVLSSALAHPHVVRTLKWAVVRGPQQLPRRANVQGQTLPSGPGAQGGTNGVLTLSGGDDVNGIGTCDLGGQTWLVMEYCDNGCLQDAIDRGWLRTEPSFTRGGPNLVAVLATAREIAAGMAHLHSLGVVHGDLSAFNVMLTTSGPQPALGGRGFTAKVADFGLSRMLGAHESRVHTAHYGTLTHMAPEVLCDGEVSKAADVYSFGVLLWQMVTGCRPWPGMGHAAVIHAVAVEGRTLKFPPSVADAVAQLGSGCLARDPKQRPSFQDVLEILEPLAE